LPGFFSAYAKPANRAADVKESHNWTECPAVWKIAGTCIVALTAWSLFRSARMSPVTGVSNAGVGHRSTAWQAPSDSQRSIPARIVSLKGVLDMRELDSNEQQATSGGVQALPGSVVTKALMMGSWTPWVYGVAAFAGGFQVGTYLYENFDTQILDGIDAVVN